MCLYVSTWEVNPHTDVRTALVPCPSIPTALSQTAEGGFNRNRPRPVLDKVPKTHSRKHYICSHVHGALCSFCNSTVSWKSMGIRAVRSSRTRQPLRELDPPHDYQGRVTHAHPPSTPNTNPTPPPELPANARTTALARYSKRPG